MAVIYITCAFDQNDVSGGGLPLMAYRTSKEAYDAVERSKAAEKEWHAARERATAGLVRPDPSDLADFEFDQDINHPYRGGGESWFPSKDAAVWDLALTNWAKSEEASSISRRWTREDGVFEVEIAD